MPKDGGAIEIIDDDVHQARQIALDATHVTWASDTFGTDAVVRMRLQTGGPLAEIASGQGGVKALLSDDENLYWITDRAGGASPATVVRYEKLTGTTTAIVEHDVCPFDMTQDATHLYWAAGDCTVSDDALLILRIRKDAAAGDTPEIVIDGREGAPLTVAVDDEFVYWIEADFELYTAQLLRTRK